MATEDLRSHWNEKYQHGLPSLELPDPFFVSAFEDFIHDRFPHGGTALDLAGGIGRHALWLAEQKWQVSVVDISEVAIRQLEETAHRLGLDLSLFTLDASDFPFTPDQFDLIVLFYHFDRNICGKLLSALKPGGVLVCKSSIVYTTYEGAAPVNLKPLSENEILEWLPGLEVIIHRERPVRDRGVVEYVGVRRGGG